MSQVLTCDGCGRKWRRTDKTWHQFRIYLNTHPENLSIHYDDSSDEAMDFCPGCWLSFCLWRSKRKQRDKETVQDD